MATGRLDDIENIFNSRGINKGTVWLKLPCKLICYRRFFTSKSELDLAWRWFQSLIIERLSIVHV